MLLAICYGTAGGEPYKESPYLQKRVAAGELPPVHERLPDEPAVVSPVEEIGEFGGTWRRVHMGMPDQAGWLRITYDPLLRWSTDYERIEPNIARKWEVSPDGRTFTFYLREGMHWSDGAPFTADDYLFWYEDVVQNDDLTPVKPSWLMMAGELGAMKKVDDLTFLIRFAKSNAVILKWLASWTDILAGPWPKHYLKQYHPHYTPQQTLDELADHEDYDTWMGLFDVKRNPFLNPDRPVLSAWQSRTKSDASIFIGERNPYYWKVDPEGNQLPYIDRIEMTLIQSEQAVTLKAIAGQIDMQSRRINFQDYPLLMEHKEKGDYRVFVWKTAGTGQGTVYLNQNYRHIDPVMGDLLRNRKFRIALSLAIDRQEIVDLFYMGITKPQQIVPHEGFIFHVPGLDTLYTSYDVEAANRILDEIGLDKQDSAGYRLRADGKRLQFTIEAFTPSTQYVDIAERLAMHWRKIGILSTVKPEDVALWVVRARAGEQHVSIYGASGGFRPMMDPVWFFPAESYAYWAPLNGLWYSSGGRAGEKPDGDIMRIVEIYDEAKSTLDDEHYAELVKEAVRLHANNLWRIGVCTGFEPIFVVKNHFRNVPEFSLSDNPLLTPGHTHPEQYFIRQNGVKKR